MTGDAKTTRRVRTMQPVSTLRLALSAALSFALVTQPSVALAQLKASEIQTISQTVDGTNVTIEYSRPRLRGRDVVFGTRAVQWGEVWTPGANYATTLEVNNPITLSGVPVPKGKYGLWMIVAQDSSWTMLLDPVWRQFHMDHPKPSDRHIKVTVKADSSADWSEEALTFSFPAVTARGATIAMHWHRMRVTMDYTVEPTLTDLLPEQEATQYLGRYALTSANPADTASGAMIMTYEGGGLKARFEPEDTYMQKFALMKVGPDIFTAGLYMAAEVYAAGEVYEVFRPDFMLTFTTKDGTMTFEVRGPKDELYFSGRKVGP